MVQRQLMRTSQIKAFLSAKKIPMQLYPSLIQRIEARLRAEQHYLTLKNQEIRYYRAAKQMLRKVQRDYQKLCRSSALLATKCRSSALLALPVNIENSTLNRLKAISHPVTHPHFLYQLLAWEWDDICEQCQRRFTLSEAQAFCQCVTGHNINTIKSAFYQHIEHLDSHFHVLYNLLHASLDNLPDEERSARRFAAQQLFHEIGLKPALLEQHYDLAALYFARLHQRWLCLSPQQIKSITGTLPTQFLHCPRCFPLLTSKQLIKIETLIYSLFSDRFIWREK